MPTAFHATEVTVVQEHDVLVTTLRAPSTEDDDFYLMLQHKLEYDEQDVAFGMDKPYLEFCGQGWFWYGHIVSFHLLREQVKVKLDAEAAKEMANDGNIVISFNLEAQDFERFRAALLITFAGQSYFADEA